MAFADPGISRQILASGVGPEAPTVTLAEACKRGDVLGYSAGWKRALATVGTAIKGLVVALADGAIGDVIPVSQSPIVGGYTGATPGGYVYVAEGTDNGKITQTAPSTAGDICNRIGIALSATEVAFSLGSIIPPSAAIADAPAGGTGATAGAYDSAANRDLMIAAINAIIAALEAHGIVLKD
jgi:hypothetical protein